MFRAQEPQSLKSVLVLIVLFLSSPAFGWGAKGHQIVALIAESHLDESTRDKIKTLLPKNGSLAQAAVWPDQIRKTLPQFDRLHYVDVPRGATGYDRQRDCPESNCVVEAIRRFSVCSRPEKRHLTKSSLL